MHSASHFKESKSYKVPSCLKTVRVAIVCGLTMSYQIVSETQLGNDISLLNLTGGRESG